MGGDGDETVEYRAEEADALTTEYREARIPVPGCALVKEGGGNRSPRRPGIWTVKGKESSGVGVGNRMSGNYVQSALSDAPLEGREKEFNDRSTELFGIGTQLPWAALLSPEARAEMRAATVAPDTGGTNSRSILGRVFAKSAADFLGVVSLRWSQPGAQNFPVLSGGVVPANTLRRRGRLDETAAILTANVLDPIRSARQRTGCNMSPSKNSP